jgi:hypothetical protein
MTRILAEHSEILIADYVAWLGCNRDLKAWFETRFVVSRLSAI